MGGKLEAKGKDETEVMGCWEHYSMPQWFLPQGSLTGQDWLHLNSWKEIRRTLCNYLTRAELWGLPYIYKHTHSCFPHFSLLAVSSILTHFPRLQNIMRTVSLSCVPIKGEMMGVLKSSIQFDQTHFIIPFDVNHQFPPSVVASTSVSTLVKSFHHFFVAPLNKFSTVAHSLNSNSWVVRLYYMYMLKSDQ